LAISLIDCMLYVGVLVGGALEVFFRMSQRRRGLSGPSTGSSIWVEK